MRVAVLIPALNEAESLPHVLAELPRDLRVVVADNGSDDGTADVATAAGAEVVQAHPRGYGTAVLTAMSHVADDPPDIVVILDADHADDPQGIHRLVEPIQHNRADMVLSDRTALAEPGALTALQRFGNGLATFLIARVTGHRYADMGPFRAIRWTSLQSLNMRDPTWGWNVEMQMKALHHGLRVQEIPMPYRLRARGKSKISGSLRGAIRAGFRILWAVHHYRQPR